MLQYCLETDSMRMAVGIGEWRVAKSEERRAGTEHYFRGVKGDKGLATRRFLHWKWFFVQGTVDEPKDLVGAAFPDLTGQRLDRW